MPKRSRSDRSEHGEILSAVAGVYRDLEARPVDRDCQFKTECCHFRLTGLTPQVTRGEAFYAAAGLKASGRVRVPESPDGACPFLRAENGRCMIYSHRPFGCRTHFCAAAGGTVPRREVIDLIRRLEAIDSRAGGKGPRAFLPAVREALESAGRQGG